MRWISVLLVIVAFLAPATPVQAQAEVLQVIPEDAIGFVLVNRLGQTNDKFTTLAKRLKIDLPGNPLDMAKGALGVEKGLAEKGSVAVAAFAGTGENDPPKPLIFVPVTDYQTFIDQLQPGKPTEGVSSVKLKDGKSMLAGKRGNFAVLARPDDGDLLAQALKSNQSLATWGEPLADWLTQNDVAGVLTGRGVKLVGMHARKGLDEAKQNLAALPPEAQFVVKIFDGMESCIKSTESDVTHLGLAVRLDQGGNLHISKRAQFLKGSGFAKTGASIKALPGGPLGGLPSGPFVIALGGTLPENAMQSLLSFNMEILKAGGQNIPEESLKKLEVTYAKMMKGMSGMGFVWQVGKENQPLFANMAGVMHTDNATAYLAEYEKSIVAMSEILKDLNLPFAPAYQVKKVKVNGKPGLEMSMDFAAVQGLPEEAQKIFKSMFGPDGKMTISVAVKDEKTLVMRYTGADSLKEMLGSQAKGLADDAGMGQASKALPMGAQWGLYLSPKGLTEFADRTVKAVSPLPLNVPQFPATPPVAVGARISGQGFEVHTVVPAEVLDNVGEFVEQLKRLFRGAV